MQKRPHFHWMSCGKKKKKVFSLFAWSHSKKHGGESPKFLAGFPLKQLHLLSLLPVEGNVGLLWEPCWKSQAPYMWERPRRRDFWEVISPNDALNFWRCNRTSCAASYPREPLPTDKPIMWPVNVRESVLQLCIFLFAVSNCAVSRWM